MSIKSDYDKKILKASQNLETAVSSEFKGSTSDKEVYSRDVVINNIGKTAKSNYVVSFSFDTWTIYKNFKSGATCSDYRFYNTDGSLLEHYVQAPLSPKTVFFVKIPNIGASEIKTIKMKYGNPALNNLSDPFVVDTTFWTDNIGYWGSANEAVKWFHDGTVNGGIYNATEFDFIKSWRNRTGVQNNLFSKSSFLTLQEPKLKYNFLNSLPVVEFNTFFGSQQSAMAFPEEISVGRYKSYSLSSPNPAQTYVFVIRFISLVDQIILAGKAGAPQIALVGGKIIFKVVGGATTLLTGSTTLSVGSWYIVSVIWDGGLSVQIRVNGVADGNAVASYTISQRPSLIAVRNFSGYNTYGKFYLAEHLLFTTSLSTLGQVQEVETYLNRKYRIYTTSDFPSVSVGSEVNNPDYVIQYSTKQSLAFTSRFVKKSELAQKTFGFEEATADFEVAKNLEKPIVSCNSNFSVWSNSSESFEQLQPTLYNRTKNINTSSLADVVNIVRIINGVERSRLDRFYISNEVSGLDYIDSDNADFIVFKLNFQNKNEIDFDNSYLRFSDLSELNYFNCPLSNNLNQLDQNGGYIRLLKSDFTLSGTGDWQTLSKKMHLNIITSVGSQQVYYSSFKLVYDYEKIYQNSINYASFAYSSDSGSTYYNLLLDSFYSESRHSTDKVLSYSGNGIIKLLSSLKFSDLPSFPSNDGSLAIHFANEMNDIANYEFQKATWALKRILQLFFPNTMLDIDLTYTDENNLVIQDPQIKVLVLDKSQNIGDLIKSILESCYGVLYFNTDTGKVTARQAHSLFNSKSYVTPKLIEPYYIPREHIISYNDNTKLPEEGYKEVNFDTLEALNITEPSVVHYSSDNSDLLDVLRSTTLYFEPSVFEEDYSNYINDLRVDSFICVDNPDSNITNNSSISVTSISWEGTKIKVTIENSSLSIRYLKAITIYSFSVAHSIDEDKLNIYPANNSKNQKILKINPLFACISDNHYEFLEKFSSFKTVEIETIISPYIYIGGVYNVPITEYELVKAIATKQTIYDNTMSTTFTLIL